MRKLLIILIPMILLSHGTNAQLWKLRRYEVTGGIGTTQLFGDIGGYSNNKNLLGLRDFTFRHTRININSGAKYRITENISVRACLAFGLFHSTDAGGSNQSSGFEEKTIFFEPSFTGEYCFIKNKEENSFLFLKGEKAFLKSLFQSLDFYTFTGFGGLIYKVNPNEALKPFVTKKSGFTGVVPLGIGVNMIYSNKFNFAIEYGARLTFSDNIDGYTSAHSTSNDIYHMVNFIVSYKINSGEMGGK
jgi:hypothetical protein